MARTLNTKSKAAGSDDIDLDSLSREELEDLKVEVAAAIEGFREREKAMALKEVTELLAKHDLTLADIVKVGPSGRVTKTVSVPKFANPEDPSETRSGKGRRPAWFQAAIDKGTSADDMRLPES